MAPNYHFGINLILLPMNILQIFLKIGLCWKLQNLLKMPNQGIPLNYNLLFSI